MIRRKTVVLLSGGLDSSTLAYYLRHREGHEVHTLSVAYGQRHIYELQAADEITRRLGVEGTHADLDNALAPIFAGAESSQVGKQRPVPYGHYAAENMKTTIVPNRNMLLLSLAGALAVSRGYDSVAFAAHAGDHAVYPDCRPEFFEAAKRTLQIGAGLEVLDPFIGLTKTDIVRLGNELGVPFQVTYSCYEGGRHHCGHCGTCTERIEAFKDARVVDPTVYGIRALY